jgi:hypothetical protein
MKGEYSLIEYEYRTIKNPVIGDRVTFLKTAAYQGQLALQHGVDHGCSINYSNGC